jgi:hypothetical protein
MMNVSKSSWHMKVPEYLSYFYAINQTIFALGLMDAMLGPLLGTSDEMVPVFSGPVGDFGNMGVAISALCLGFMFRIDESTAPDQVKKIFQVFLFEGLFWGAFALPFAFVNGIMGVPGIAQFGTLVWVLHIGVSALVLSKL